MMKLQLWASPDAAWNDFVAMRAVNGRKAENHKVDLSKAYRFVGVTRFSFAALPDELFRKVKQNLLRGYSVTRNGNVFHWTQAAINTCPVERIKLGFICRQYMELFVDVPSLSKERYEFGKELQALCGVTGKVQAQCMRFDTVDGWLKVSGSAAWSQDNAESGARFKEVRLFVDEVMKSGLAKRQRVVEWLERKPTVMISFDSL